MIQKKSLLLFSVLFLSSSALATNYYVSDDLYTYTHKGPGTKYRILGTVNAGEPLNVLSTDDNEGYIEILDNKGRSVWIDSKHVSNQPGLKRKLEELRILEEKANKKITNLEKDLQSNIEQVHELKKTNLMLNSKLKKTQEINDSLTDKVDNEKNELLMQWFSYGGMVGGIGLVLGLILPLLFPSRKKKSSW